MIKIFLMYTKKELSVRRITKGLYEQKKVIISKTGVQASILRTKDINPGSGYANPAQICRMNET